MLRGAVSGVRGPLNASKMPSDTDAIPTHSIGRNGAGSAWDADQVGEEHPVLCKAGGIDGLFDGGYNRPKSGGPGEPEVRQNLDRVL